MANVKELIRQFNEKAERAAREGRVLTDKEWWAEVGDIVTDPKRSVPTRVRNAFSGPVEIVHLRAGTTLYKFNDFNSLQSPAARERNEPISPWWSPYYPFRHDPGWQAKVHLAQHLGVSIREFGRVTSAVKENWNSLRFLCVITLRAGVRAAFGGFAQMRRRDLLRASKVQAGEGRGLTENLPGGGTQFYIPQLDARNVSARFESLDSR
jgi:hypothetical protein